MIQQRDMGWSIKLHLFGWDMPRNTTVRTDSIIAEEGSNFPTQPQHSLEHLHGATNCKFTN